MPQTYVNRRGQTYYLHLGKTKSGRPQFYFSLSSEGVLADELPSEYEVRERENGQVTVRKARPQIISDQEVRELEEVISAFIPAERYYVDRDGATLTLFVLDVDGEHERVFREIASPFISDERLFETLRRSSAFEAVFRFQLVKPEYRVYQTERYCSRGSIDRWINVGALGFLPDLAKTYVPHVGQDSYFELFF